MDWYVILLVRKYIALAPGRKGKAMTREEAKKYINKLTLEEKLQLYAVLSTFELERQPCHVHIEENCKNNALFTRKN